MSAESTELIEKFIAYRINYDRISANTVAFYTTWLNRWASFVEEHGYDLLTVTPNVFIAYKNSLEGKRNATIKSYWSSLAAFYTWASGPAILLIATNPMPKIRLGASARLSSLIPSARDIFSMRSSQKINTATKAAAFELLLSSGMRISELGQIRCSDLIIASEIIDDVELGRKSPFVGGSIKLSIQHGFTIKRNMSRKVYFSRIAAKMLQIHMVNQGLSLEDNLPLFPYDNSTYNRWLTDIGEDVINRTKVISHRSPTMGDIDTNKLSMQGNVNKKFIASLKRAKGRKESLEKEFPGIKSNSRIEPERKLTFHPHCLRHFFACLMYYRSWHGTHTDISTLTLLLGHTGVSQSIHYMKSDPVCRNMTEWKQVMLGNGMEYRTLLY
jgi:integrase